MIDWNYILNQVATVAFDIIYFGAIIGTIVVIILDNRNPVKTLAWILVLMFLPVVGLVFYFFFGRSRRRERIIEQKIYNRLLNKPMVEYLAQDATTLPIAYSGNQDSSPSVQPFLQRIVCTLIALAFFCFP